MLLSLQCEATGSTTGDSGGATGSAAWGLCQVDAGGMSVAKGRCGVNYSEQPPSTQWSALKYRGETIAEVWFKPEAEPLALTFRIRRASFQVAGVGQRLKPENLLKAVCLAAEAVESCRHQGASLPEPDGFAPDLGRPLPTPLQDVTHLTLHVRLKPPPQAI